MSLYDRDYMGGGRTSGGRGAFRGYPGWGGEFWRTPVGALILINVAVYIAEFFIDGLIGAGRFYSFFALSLNNVEHFYLWTLVSYSFLHAGFLHILLNMVGLYFFGVPLEGRFGKTKFFVLYFGGVLAAALMWLAVNYFFGAGASGGMLGASGAVMALFACFCVMAPERPLTFLLFFVLPITVRPIVIFRVALVFECVSCLVFEVLGQNGSNVAYSAHLGGLLFGYAAAKFILREMPSISLPSFFKRKKDSNGWQKPISYQINLESPDAFRAETDRILDKITAQGFSSLTDSERETLRNAKTRYK